MICPKCRGGTKVVYARPSAKDAAIFERQRVCVSADCGERFISYETTANIVTRRVEKARRGGARKIQDISVARQLALRKDAEAEGRRLNKPASEILKSWGVSAKPSRPASSLP